jgi:hypothetical protein
MLLLLRTNELRTIRATLILRFVFPHFFLKPNEGCGGSGGLERIDQEAEPPGLASKRCKTASMTMVPSSIQMVPKSHNIRSTPI